MLEADKATGVVTIYDRNGEVVAEQHNVAINQIGELQNKAKNA